MVRRVLTDEQHWAILTAPPETSTAALARRFGVGYHTVYAFRFADRPHGWSCRLTPGGPCAVCGAPMLVPPQSRGMRRHRMCAIEADRRRLLARRHADARFRERVYDRTRERHAALQEATAGLDTNRRHRWSDADKLYLWEHRHEVYTVDGAERLARTLGRSYAACQTMLGRIAGRKTGHRCTSTLSWSGLSHRRVR